MKKTFLIILVCAILIIIIEGVCFINSTSYIKIEQNIEKITIRNGNTGESIDVTSSKEINNLISQINSLELKKEHKISSGTGWEIMLNIYFAKNEKISSFVIRIIISMEQTMNLKNY